MKYLFEKDNLTCETLEAESGLAKGSIKSMTISPDGSVEVESDLVFSTAIKNKIRASLEKRGLN